MAKKAAGKGERRVMNRYEKKVVQFLKRRFETSYYKRLFNENKLVIPQWRSTIGKRTYSPRIDIAVGPFAINERHIYDYDRLCNSAKPFLNKCFRVFRKNLVKYESQYAPSSLDCFFNSNARCFLAIEIEKTNSLKHRLGDIVNASALGRIGLLIAWDESVLRSFIRIVEYFGFLKNAGKNTFKTPNIAIIDKEQFVGIMKEFV